MTLPLVLGSGSKYRRAIMDKLHLIYNVVKPDIDESAVNEEQPEQLVGRLAEEKAQAVARKLNGEPSIIIGSDQVAVCDGLILGKPGTEEKAIEQLKSFVGKTVTFYTGLAVLNSETSQCEVRIEPFFVTFRDNITADEIARYV